ncbi:MAG: murein biosynthesis integral membrane protein MurJ [Luteolibacter sp.]|uniref:murein biosynthesis integral membrane protein MurJ n=1 Tax=Luteolibacter sp. TaxID=1962973 RepID=UPI003267A0F5
MSAKATWKVSAAVMASRVLGLAREMMFTTIFGATDLLGSFQLAFRIPNLLRDLFAEGALSQAFVTTFSKRLKSEGDESAWALANKMMTLATVFMSLITVVGILAAPWLVDLLTMLARDGTNDRALGPDQIALTVTMVRVMYPFILLVSLAALVMGMLNAKNVFGMPALSSCFFNLGSMIGGAAIGYWMDPKWGPQSLIGFSIGVVIGGLAQLVCQFPALRTTGYRFAMDFNWRDSGVRQILRLMGPAVISSSVVQVNVVVNSMFAAGISLAAVSWLNCAFRLMQLPIGIFGVAVATVTLPALSRAAIGGISPEFSPTLAKGLRLVAFLVIPSTIGLAVLAEPIISVIYEHGKFTALQREQTALALRAYGYGLVFYAALKVLQPAFYAIDKRWFPMLVSFLALGLNLGFNYLFVYVFKWGHESLALTTSITASVNFLLLYLAMRKFSGDPGTVPLLVMLGKLLIAGGLMAAVCMLANHYLFADLAHTKIWLKIILLSATMGAASLVYFISAQALRVAEAGEALGMITRKLRR